MLRVEIRRGRLRSDYTGKKNSFLATVSDRSKTPVADSWFEILAVREQDGLNVALQRTKVVKIERIGWMNIFKRILSHFFFFLFCCI